MRRSKLVLGCVVTLAVVGIGAGAVALESDSGGAGALDGTTTTTVDPSTTTTTAAPTTTVAPVVDPTAPAGNDASGDGGVERSTEGCDGGTYTNHGDYVSSIAHGTDRAPGDVPAAAQSDCGKPLSAVGDPTAAPEPETADTPDTPDAPETDAPGVPSGPGKGNAYGRTK